MIWLPYVVTFAGLIILVVTIISSAKLYQKSAHIDLPANAPIIINPSRTAFTDGYSLGIVKRQVLRKNNCFLIEFYPTDPEQSMSFLSPAVKPEIQSIIVHKAMVKRLARGEFSSRREVIFLSARDPTALPEKMRDTEEGKWMTKEGQLAWLEKTFGKAIIAGDEAIAKAQENYARGEVGAAAIAKIEEIANKKAEILASEMPKEKSENK